LNGKNADKERFIAMLKENKGILLKVIRAYCKNSSDWKDLEQEIIIQLWRSFHSYDDKFRLSTWLYRISLNVAISHYRKNRKLQNNIGLDDVIFVLPTDEPDENQNQKRNLLYEFITTLDDFNKALIILHLEDHSNKEIAQMLGISESNVSTKINRIKNKFRTSIQTSHEHKRIA
jgi:RNA polymerase sigma factor (sigma-70 family)